MSTEPANLKTFVSSWLEKAKADTALNQDFIALLASHEDSGASAEDAIFKALLTAPLKKEVPGDVH